MCDVAKLRCNIDQSLAFLKHISDFRYAASFRERLKVTAMQDRG